MGGCLHVILTDESMHFKETVSRPWCGLQEEYRPEVIRKWAQTGQYQSNLINAHSHTLAAMAMYW